MKMTVLLRGLTISAALALGFSLLLTACSDDDDATSTTGPTPTAPGTDNGEETSWTPPVTTGGSPLECEDCLEDLCGEEMGSCQGDADCAAILECVQDCPLFAFEACSAECKAANPAGATLFDTALACVQSNCRMCLEGDECEQCLSTRCSTQAEACFADAECAAAVRCVDACVEGVDPTDCIDQCLDDPETADLFNAFLGCAEGECPVCFDEGPSTAPPTPATDPGTPSGPGPAPTTTGIGPDACDICIATNCGTEFDACMADEDCAAVQGCVADCANTGDRPFIECLDTCAGAPPEWDPLFAAAFACVQANCSECIPS